MALGMATAKAVGMGTLCPFKPRLSLKLGEKKMKMLMVGAAALMMFPATAMAQVATSASESATLTLTGAIPVECSLGLGDKTTNSATRSVDLKQGRLTNQAMPSLYYGCNAPYALTVSSSNGGMRNLNAPSGDYKYTARYGLNFNGIPTGATGGAAGLDQYELGLTKTTPFVIVNQGWSEIAHLVDQTSVLNVEVDLGAGGATDGVNYLAGAYQDVLTFEISASL